MANLSLEEIYSGMQSAPKQKSLDDIFNQVSNKPTSQQTQQVLSGNAQQEQAMPGSLTSGTGALQKGAGYLAEPYVATVGGAANLLGAEKPLVTNPISGEQTPSLGYGKQGQKLSPWDTTKQVTGTALEIAAPTRALGAVGNLVNKGKYLSKGKVGTFARGAAEPVALAATQGFGTELRETQDIPEALKTGAMTAPIGLLGGAAALGAKASVGKGATLPEQFSRAVATNDVKTVEALKSSPEAQDFLKANGFKSWDDVTKAQDNELMRVKTNIVDNIGGDNPANQQFREALRMGEYDDALKMTLADYNTAGTKLDDAAALAKARAESYQEMRDMIAEKLSKTSSDPTKLISPQEFKARVLSSVDPSIMRLYGDDVAKQVDQLLDSPLKDGVSLRVIDDLRTNANKVFEKTTFGAEIQRAIGNATRGSIDDMITTLSKSGGSQDVVELLKAYNEFNRVWGVSKQAEKLRTMIGRAVKKQQGVNKLVNFGSGAILGQTTGNPFAFYAGAQFSDWAQRAANARIEGKLLGSPLNKLFAQQGMKEADKVPELLRRVANVDKNKAIAKEKYADTPAYQPKNQELYEKPIPEEQLPEIQMGKTPKSKFAKSDKDLPSISYAAAPFATVGLIDKIKNAGKETYDRQEELAKEGKYEISGKTVTNDDLNELGAILYGEASNNKSKDELLKEITTIADIAFNRMGDKEWKGKSLSEILLQEKQFQAKGNVPYKEYKAGTEATTTEAKQKKQVVDDFITALKGGLYRNKSRENTTDLTYFHNKKDKVRTFKNYAELKKAIKDIK